MMTTTFPVSMVQASRPARRWLRGYIKPLSQNPQQELFREFLSPTVTVIGFPVRLLNVSWYMHWQSDSIIYTQEGAC